MATAHSSRSSFNRRRWLPPLTLVIAGLVAAAGCSADEQPTDAPPASAASAGRSASSSASDPADDEETSGSADGDDPAQQNEALLAAGATALGELPDATVTSIDSERRDTMWEVDLVDQDGQEHSVGVSEDGQQVTSGPSSDSEDADDRADNRKMIKAAEVDYRAAAGTVASDRPGRIVELTLDEDDGQVVWEADVRDGDTKYDVHVDAASGDVVRNQVDRDD